MDASCGNSWRNPVNTTSTLHLAADSGDKIRSKSVFFFRVTTTLT